ncbi:hypothetical protein GT204_07070 [Streptomyces sp. SID4919]|uniref:hypothetical protein n=1 Tax=unclassified Streptomyces TaxID=2593676 RepID=UPI000823B86B|nr:MULTISPECIES: hypothetical protein [unclassified Streptomyces]MYY08669.1 hypothetical protein [Streptomyces sp. SID4919]SCK55800.1 hypothetical protein YW7DRAFT_05178 [Streptomyces sp. AmelKG-E11A]
MPSFAWSGSARAYLLLDGHLRLIPGDHNQCRVYDSHKARNALTAGLGAGSDGRQTEERYGHPAAETVRGQPRPGRLLLTSDDACEPYGDDDHVLTDYRTGAPRTPVRRLVENAACLPAGRGRCPVRTRTTPPLLVARLT